MQWDDNENAGFTGLEAIPWLPINNNYMEINVNREREEIGSLLMVYRELMHIRQERTALQEGILELIEPPKIPVHLLAYKRIFPNALIIVLINFGESEGVFKTQYGTRADNIPNWEISAFKDREYHPFSEIRIDIISVTFL